MASTYELPQKVYLTFELDSVAHSVANTITDGLVARWQRSFEFADYGKLNAQFIFFGPLTGDLTIVDLAYAADYDPTETMPASSMWLPEDLTPLDGTDLDTVEIDIYFDPDGTSGDVALTLQCVARPMQVTPRTMADGLVATDHTYRWEIRDNEQPTVGS